MIQRASFAVLAAGLLLAASPVGAITLTFDNLAEGTVLSNQYAGLGATFSPNAFSGPGTSTSGEAWATNTDMTIVSSTGADVGGLGLPALAGGNLLRGLAGWSSEDGDPSFRITFARTATGFSAAFAGVSAGADVSLFAYNGAALVSTVSGTGTGTDTSQFVLGYAGPVTSIAIRPGSFNDWVGVDNITYTLVPVPEAGTFAMVGLGLMLLAFKRRRPA
ncbi:PEP-CTERM sorting domain-containing protein [Ideonella sp. A 288]|uniref:PEP-CTERM sorting domain-containing protein n=1 Tax=Ideonella sp. A 288 TaxID=1962181 RepID=UPI001186E542|nr:PEP-CTERM sorting domain-containing protein [Ideonella sp. A 288]